MADIEFRGLAHVVEVWRASTLGQRMIVADACPPLGDILMRADEYMAWAESQPAVNESAPPPDDDPRHVIEFREDGWTIKHPLSCRPNLFDCPVNRAAEATLVRPPGLLGRFECSVTASDLLFVGNRVEASSTT